MPDMQQGLECLEQPVLLKPCCLLHPIPATGMAAASYSIRPTHLPTHLEGAPRNNVVGQDGGQQLAVLHRGGGMWHGGMVVGRLVLSGPVGGPRFACRD